MGEVVELRPDHAAQAHAERVRFVCWLVERADMADDFIRHGLTLGAVFDALRILAHRPGAAASRLRRVTGRAGTRRRALLKSPSLYRRP